MHFQWNQIKDFLCIVLNDLKLTFFLLVKIMLYMIIFLLFKVVQLIYSYNGHLQMSKNKHLFFPSKYSSYPHPSHDYIEKGVKTWIKWLIFEKKYFFMLLFCYYYEHYFLYCHCLYSLFPKSISFILQFVLFCWEKCITNYFRMWDGTK